MARSSNRFEQVDEVQTDAVTVQLWRHDGESYGRITGPVSVGGGRISRQIDLLDEPLTAVQALSEAVRMANEEQVRIVVVDPDGVWQPDWGTLYRTE